MESESAQHATDTCQTNHESKADGQLFQGQAGSPTPDDHTDTALHSSRRMRHMSPSKQTAIGHSFHHLVCPLSSLFLMLHSVHRYISTYLEDFIEGKKGKESARGRLQICPSATESHVTNPLHCRWLSAQYILYMIFLRSTVSKRQNCHKQVNTRKPMRVRVSQILIYDDDDDDHDGNVAERHEMHMRAHSLLAQAVYIYLYIYIYSIRSTEHETTQNSTKRSHKQNMHCLVLTGFAN